MPIKGIQQLEFSLKILIIKVKFIFHTAGRIIAVG